MSPQTKKELVEDMCRAAALNYDQFYTYPKLLKDTQIDLHVTYAQKIFRDYTGVTLREYLTRIRLNVAMQLIKDDVKIEAIAKLVGYHSKKNFYRRFRESFNMSPTCWKAQQDEQR